MISFDVARAKSPVVVQLEYIPVRGFSWLLRVLPERWARTMAYGLLKTIFLFIPKRRRLMRENIRRAFPTWTPQKCKKIADQSVANLARVLPLIVRIPSLFKNGSPHWIEVEDVAYFDRALQEGKGVLCFTAHYGCWEIMSAWIMKNYPKIAGVYRALDNPRLDAYVKALRTSSGGTMIERHNVLRQAMRWLKANGMIGFLIDQNFPDGVFVDFLGRPASTTPVISILARRTGAAVIPVYSRWEGRKLKIIWEKPLTLSRDTNTDRAIAEDTQALTAIVESWVRKDPGQWMWLHNRWKHQPK